MSLAHFAARAALAAASCLTLFAARPALADVPAAPRSDVAMATLPEKPAKAKSPPPDVIAPQVTVPAAIPAAPKPGEAAGQATKNWYDRIKIRGYTQVRYNQLGATNERLVNLQGDRSIGKDGGFLIRRARVILYGDVHERVSVYLQPDFASVVSDQYHSLVLRDWYADIFLDKKKEFRFRVGQSKVPYGFENMQSSSNRAPLDRSDALNSAVKDERDLGVFFYWAPDRIRKRFKSLVDQGLKGSGDYGVVALGAYNGQTANQKERNSTPHVVGRVTWPFQIGRQIVELGAGGYAGKFVVKTAGDVEAPGEMRDVRAHASFILYPQPIGLQAEYNIGRGPELVDGRVVERPLHGGYAMAMVKLGDFLPYVRGVLYEGGRKFETNAPRYSVRELEMGLEWQPISALELVAAYVFAERTHPEAPYPQESGRLVRLQAQFNY
ncbi:porin [Polyangium spumosum]|uniref:Porin n=1 Tax=Polyangium spumosum TaxID=889282 RepID=A0A6N7PFV6_9BACT|nr:porin [Polyangium spumosum]MRG90879.1 porin [Polyangium spumosum]